MQPVLPPYLIARWLVFIVLLVGLFFLKDFLVPVLGALVIGLASWPLYRKLLAYCRYRYAVAATLALVVFIGVLLIPLSMAVSFVIQEASSFVIWALVVIREGAPVPTWLADIPFFGERLSEYWALYLGEPHALGALVEMVSGEHLGNIYRMILAATGDVFHLLLNLLRSEERRVGSHVW